MWVEGVCRSVLPGRSPGRPPGKGWGWGVQTLIGLRAGPMDASHELGVVGMHPDRLLWCRSALPTPNSQLRSLALPQVRGNAKPAGGLQLVVCGDFFQLPPVTKRWERGMASDLFLNFGWAFQAPAWRRCGFAHVLLTQVGAFCVVCACRSWDGCVGIRAGRRLWGWRYEV